MNRTCLEIYLNSVQMKHLSYIAKVHGITVSQAAADELDRARMQHFMRGTNMNAEYEAYKRSFVGSDQTDRYYEDEEN